MSGRDNSPSYKILNNLATSNTMNTRTVTNTRNKDREKIKHKKSTGYNEEKKN